MIKKLHEEWERLSQEASQLQARQALDQDPKRHQEILERMTAVGGALRKLSQGSVTRTTLSQAVRDALGEILRNERESLFPELSQVRGELATLRESLDRRLSELASHSQSSEGQLGADQEKVSGEFTRLDGRVKHLEGSLASRLDRLEGRIAQELGSAPSAAGISSPSASPKGPSEGISVPGDAPGGTNGRGLWGVTRRLDQDLAVLKNQIRQDLEGTAARSGSTVQGRLIEIDGRVSEVRLQASDLASRVEAVKAEIESRLQALGAAGETAARGLQDLTSADDNLAEGLKDLEGRLLERVSSLETAAGSRREALESGLRQSLAAVETRLTEAQGRLEAELGKRVEALTGRLGRELSERVGRIEAALPELRALGDRLRKEMAKTMEQLEEKINSVVDMLGQIQSGLPPRQLFEGLDERMGKIETRIRSVSDQLDGFQGALPEVRVLGDQLGAIRGEVSGLAGEVQTSEKEVREAWDHFGRRVQDLQDLLRAGVERWEESRQDLRQRLVDLRDLLRDQLRMAGEQAGGEAASFWGKLIGKADGGLRFDPASWDRFRGRLETIVQGIEGLLVENR
jgi:chromosome segregation ATPase